MMILNLIAHLVLCCVSLFLSDVTAEGDEMIISLKPNDTLLPGSPLEIVCDTTWNRNNIFLYFTPTDASLGERQIGNSRFSLRSDYQGSRYVWSTFGSMGIKVRIEQALLTDAGTYRCEDKLLRRSKRQVIHLDDTTTPDDSHSDKRNNVAPGENDFGSISGLYVAIAAGVLVGCVFIFVAVAVALAAHKRQRKAEEGTEKESSYLKIDISGAYESPSFYEKLNPYAELTVSKEGVTNPAIPIYAECGAEVESKNQMSSHYMEILA